MDPEQYKQKLSQVAEWYYRSGSNNQPSEPSDDPTQGIIIRRFLFDPQPCPDCDRTIDRPRVIRIRRLLTCDRWSETCNICSRARDFDTGEFTSTEQIAMRRLRYRQTVCKKKAQGGDQHNNDA